MADIVERLHNLDHPTTLEAADTIESLRAALRAAADDLDNASRRTALTHVLLSRDLHSSAKAHRAALMRETRRA